MKKLGKKTQVTFEAVSSLAHANNGNCSCPCYVANTRYNDGYAAQRRPL